MSPRIGGFGSPRARKVALVVVALAIVTAGGWAFVAGRNQRSGSTDGGSSSASTPGMKDMPGMNITSNGSVQLTAGQIRQFGITFGTVEVRPLTAETRTNG